MKRKLSFIALSLCLMSGSIFAAKSAPIIIKNPNYSPVHWHATIANGGFGLANQTSKTQYVQVIIKTGEITVFTMKDGEIGKCREDLNAIRGPFSVICELAPGDGLNADIDIAMMAEATGTYQVKMEKYG